MTRNNRLPYFKPAVATCASISSRQRLGSVDALSAAHVAVRHQADRVRPERADQHAARLEPGDEIGSAAASRQPEDRRYWFPLSRDRSTRLLCLQAPRPAIARWHDRPRAAPVLLRAQSILPRPARPPASFRRPAPCERPAPAPSTPPSPPASILPARPVPSTGRTSPCRIRASAFSHRRPAPRRR